MRCKNNCGCIRRSHRKGVYWVKHQLCPACYILKFNKKIDKRNNNWCKKVIKQGEILSDKEQRYYLSLSCMDNKHEKCIHQPEGFSFCRCYCHEVQKMSKYRSYL